MKTRNVVIIVTAVIFISFAISTFSSIVSQSSLAEKANQKEAELIISILQRDLVDSFDDSVGISQAINNSLIQDFINNRAQYSDAEASDSMEGYLRGIKNQFGFDTSFLVLESTKEYYTEYGLMKNLDLNSEDDSWYSNFKKSGKDMELNIDNDQANGNRITIYVNIRMTDKGGNFLGVCGVGHTLEKLNLSIDSIESKYGLTVMLADKEGTIQVAGNESYNGTEIAQYIKDYIVNYDYSLEYEYEKIGTGGYIMVKYVPEYDWYLCVEGPQKVDEMSRSILYTLLAALIALIIMVKIISVAMKYQADETLLFKADSETDMMTGLYNRRAFDNMLESIRASKSIRDISVVVIDVNGLKQINDEKGHLAGDELIIKTAECIKEMYGNHGRCFRLGGDEFTIILLEPLDDIDELIKQIKARISICKLENADSLSVSIGVARGEDYQSLSIDELLEIADKAMYSDKEEYYKDNRHERRSR